MRLPTLEEMVERRPEELAPEFYCHHYQHGGWCQLFRANDDSYHRIVRVREGQLSFHEEKWFSGPAPEAIARRGNHEFELHRVGGPASMSVFTDGFNEQWWVRGKCHREGAPAWRGLYRGQYREACLVDGEHHGVARPAITIIEPDGSRTEVWYQAGLIHRADGPSITLFLADGGRVETYIERSMLRQTPQTPGRVVYDPDGRSARLWIDPTPDLEWIDPGFEDGFTAGAGRHEYFRPAYPHPPGSPDSGWRPGVRPSR